MIVPVRKRKLPFPVGLDRYVVAEDGAQIIEVAFFMGHGDQPPVAIAVRKFSTEDWRCLIFGMPRRERQGRKNGQRYRDCEYEDS